MSGVPAYSTLGKFADPVLRSMMRYDDLELVGIIQDLMKARHLKPDVQNIASGEIREQYLSAEKAHKVLKWQPKYTLEEGLKETIEWYKEYLAAHKEQA